jgi:hypothetical protein
VGGEGDGNGGTSIDLAVNADVAAVIFDNCFGDG